VKASSEQVPCIYHIAAHGSQNEAVDQTNRPHLYRAVSNPYSCIQLQHVYIQRSHTQQSHGVGVGARPTAAFAVAAVLKEVAFRALLVAHLELYWGTKPGKRTSFSARLAVEERTPAEAIQTTRPGRSKQSCPPKPDAPLLSRAWRYIGSRQITEGLLVFGQARRLCYTVPSTARANRMIATLSGLAIYRTLPITGRAGPCKRL
jgi:hypothetical protein